MIRSLWVLPVVFATGCAARVFTPPSGPAEPFAGAQQVWTTVTERCRGAQRYVAQLRVQGWVGSKDQRIAQTLNGAVTRTDDIYLELRMLGSTAFQMAGAAGQATFVLPRETRVLRGATRDMVGALTGLQWGARELLDVLSGCVAASTGVTGESAGHYLHVAVAPGASAWLRQRDGGWQVHAARIDDLLVEYRLYDGGWPSSVRVTSAGDAPLELQFSLSQLRVNDDLAPDTFQLTVPSHYLPMTLEELRSIGPLRARGTEHSAPGTSTEHPALKH